MFRKKNIIKYASIFALIGLICLMLLNHFFFNKSIKDWDTAKSAVDKMKKEVMKIHSFSGNEYIQCSVGIWILATVEPDDIKKLMKLKECTEKEKEAVRKTITLIKNYQTLMRVLFYVNKKQIKDVWNEQHTVFLIKLLKEEPPNTSLDDFEISVVDAFYKEYRNHEDVLKQKITGGKSTFVENAIKRVPQVFKDCVFKSTE